MFKDLPEGTTHSENDGCGIKEHNKECGALIQVTVMGDIKCANKKPCKTHLKNIPICLCGKPISDKTLKQMEKEFQQFIAEEINQAQKDGFPTSRLTSLAMKATKLFK